MCSSPKPKSKAKGKKSGGGSILANISPESRSRFSERANAAQDRRDEMKAAQKQKALQHNTLTNRSLTSAVVKTKKQEKSFGYWLLNASVKDIFVLLFMGKSKTI